MNIFNIDVAATNSLTIQSCLKLDVETKSKLFDAPVVKSKLNFVILLKTLQLQKVWHQYVVLPHFELRFILRTVL